MLDSTLLGLSDWEGSLEDLTHVAKKLMVEETTGTGKPLRAPTRSMVVDYRNVGLISPAQRKRYRWLHLVQLVVACFFVQSGQHRRAVAKRLQNLTPNELIALLNPDAPSVSPTNTASDISPTPTLVSLKLAHELVPLLAAGLVEHFRRVRAGQPLIHDINMSHWLRGAISRLAAIHVILQQPVRSDGAHTIVAQSTKELCNTEWNIPAFDHPDFRFHRIRLLDENTRLPSIECIEIAKQISTELDLLEQQAFEQLNATCDQFAVRGNEVYSTLRAFITRHPITTAIEQRKFLQEHNLQLAAPFLSSCYESIQPHHLISARLWQCANCKTPLMPSVISEHVSCTVRQCKSFDLPVPLRLARQLSVKESVVAKPHILLYWCGPGLDEILLFDTTTREQPQLRVTLYPGRDKCDIGLDGDVTGIDVKSHVNPFLLAEILNRSLGGLELFSKKYIAINDQALAHFPGYLEIIRRECHRKDVVFMSVTELRKKLRAHE